MGAAANAGASRARLRHALAGLQAGVVGFFWMMACFAVAAAWNRRSLWLVPNLFATTFFGPNAYSNRWVRTSGTGLAFMLAIYGLGGILWGLAWGERRKNFFTLIGAITGLLVYLLLFGVIWRYLNPLMALYAPDGQLEFAHLFWGMMLARSPAYSRKIALANQEPPPLPPAEIQEPAEVNSGDATE